MASYPEGWRDPGIVELAHQPLSCCTASGGKTGGNTILVLYYLASMERSNKKRVKFLFRLKKAIFVAAARDDPYASEVIQHIVHQLGHQQGNDVIAEWMQNSWDGGSKCCPYNTRTARMAAAQKAGAGTGQVHGDRRLRRYSEGDLLGYRY